MEETNFKRPEYHCAKVQVIGRIHEPAVLRESGQAYFVVWVNGKRPARSGEAVPDKTQHLRCVRFNAANWAKYCTKNRKIYIEGRLEGFYKQQPDGTQRVEMMLNCDETEWMDTPSGQNGTGAFTAGEMAELQERNARLQEFNAELKGKMDELTAANDEWEKQYRALDAEMRNRSEKQDVEAPTVKPQRATAKQPASGKGKGR